MPSQPTAGHRLSRPRTKLRILSVAAIITGGLLIASPAHATGTTLDNTFGIGGKTTTNLGLYAYGISTAVQADGKIVVAGVLYDNNFAGDFAVVRYNADGSLDSTFDGDGKTITNLGGDDQGNSVVIQSDGKILVAGSRRVNNDTDFAVVRYNANGSLDNTFGTGGITTTDFGNNDTGFSMALQPDGKLLVAGKSGGTFSSDFAVVRYNANGSLDNTFGTGGKTTTNLGTQDVGFSLALQPDGKIVLAGRSGPDGAEDFAVVRYTTTGTVDFTTTTDFGFGAASGNSIALQPDEKIVVAGGIWQGEPINRSIFAMARYNADGSLDSTFDDDGKTITDLGGDSAGNSVAVQPDGKLVVAGYFGATGSNDFDFALLRYNANGSPDSTFDGDFIITTDFGGTAAGTSMVMQSDGTLFVAGHTWLGGANQLALARYTTTPLVLLAATSPTSSSAPISFTVTGNGSIDCTTLSTVAGIDFDLTGITAITEIEQTSPTVCTISATSSAAADGVPVTSTLTAASSFSISFANAAALTVMVVPSQSITVTIPIPLTVPDAPTIGSVTPTDGTLSVAFSAPGFNGGTAVTNYQHSLNGATWVTHNPASTATPMVITGLSNGTEYQVRIRAVNTVGAGAISNTVTATPVTSPDAPTIGSVTPTDGTLSVAFSAPGFNGGTAVTNYQYSLNGATWVTRNPASTATPMVITGLSNGTEYEVRIRAVNAVGAGAISNTVTATPPPPVPAVALITTPAITPTTTTAPIATNTTVPTPTTTTPAADPVPLMPTVDVINALPVSNDLISTRFLGRGNRLFVRFSGFVPFEFVRLIVASTPQVVGSGYADAQGDVELTGTLPLDLAPGDHRLVVHAPTSGRGASQSISVEVPQLPATGVNSSLVLSMTLIAIGTAFYAVRRRTRELRPS